MSDREGLRNAVSKLMQAHGRDVKGPILAHWVQRLERFTEVPNAKVWKVLDLACDGARMPALADIVEASHAHHGDGPPKIEPLTVAQQKRADQSAVLSMLWLVYVKHWKPRDFVGSIFGRVFAQQNADPETFIAAAKAAFNEVTVRQWMRDQETAGN